MQSGETCTAVLTAQKEEKMKTNTMGCVSADSSHFCSVTDFQVTRFRMQQLVQSISSAFVYLRGPCFCLSLLIIKKEILYV